LPVCLGKGFDCNVHWRHQRILIEVCFVYNVGVVAYTIMVGVWTHGNTIIVPFAIAAPDVSRVSVSGLVPVKVKKVVVVDVVGSI